MARHRQGDNSPGLPVIGPGVGVEREDSDDELGLEDHPWEWIIEDRQVQKAQDQGSNESTPEEDLTLEDGAAGISKPMDSSSSLRTRSGIVGARMGDFSCKLGDCVFLKAEGTNEAWVAIICEFMTENDGTKAAVFMWFSTEKEIRNKTKKRMDFLDVRRQWCYHEQF
jgi:origin recognition complex subunit 1